MDAQTNRQACWSFQSVDMWCLGLLFSDRCMYVKGGPCSIAHEKGQPYFPNHLAIESSTIFDHVVQESGEVKQVARLKSSDWLLPEKQKPSMKFVHIVKKQFGRSVVMSFLCHPEDPRAVT